MSAPLLSGSSAFFLGVLNCDGGLETTATTPALPPTSLVHPKAPAILLDEIEIWEGEGCELHLLWSQGTQIYYKAIPEGPYELDGLVGRQVPDTEVYAPWRAYIREAEAPPSSTTFVKYSYYSVIMKQLDGDSNLFSQVYAEIDVLERISKAAHPTIVEYRGCLRRDDLIVGICLRRYPCSLRDLVLGAVAEDVRPPYDPEVILADVQCGLNFLHNLGLVHDDITPRNIMVDENGHGIIIDFDCCRLIGSKLRGGTPGWATKPAVSLIENDEYGLSLLGKFMRGE